MTDKPTLIERLRECPVPWCAKDDAPYTYQDCTDQWVVLCPACGVNGPVGSTEEDAKESWFNLPRAADALERALPLGPVGDVIGMLQRRRLDAVALGGSSEIEISEIDAAIDALSRPTPTDHAETIANALEAGRTHAIERRCGWPPGTFAGVEADIALIEIPRAEYDQLLRDKAVMREALAGMIRLADMGLEESLREPEEHGNYAAYNRAVAALTPTQETGL